jgi:hypothetical protein
MAVAPAQQNSIANFLKCRRTFSVYVSIVYIILVIFFMYYDPYSIVKNYYGGFVFVVVFIATFLFAMIVWYHYAIDNFQSMNITRTTVSPVWRIFKQGIFILLGFSISGAVLYGIIYGLVNLTDSHSVISSIMYLVITLSLLAFIYKTLSSSKIFSEIFRIPIISLLINLIFYIPCIFVQLIDRAVKFYVIEKDRTNMTEVILLLITILCIVLYYLIPYIGNLVILQGGKQLINEPIYIDREKVIASYMELNDISSNQPSNEIKPDYSYGLSCWIYLDSNTSSYFDKYSSILNYGGKPNILYKASTNTLLITEQMDDNSETSESFTKTIKANSLTTGQELDQSGNLILYKRENMELQKWNNIILNYSNGTLDVFFNGELVKSTMNVIPYMKLDSLVVGTNNGAHGGICNLLYFKNTLSSSQISYIYNTVKDKTPPTLYTLRPTL